MRLSLLAPSRRALAAAALLLLAACAADSATAPGASPDAAAGTPPGTPAPAPAGDASRPPSSIVGAWSYGALSMIDYQNASTGAPIGNAFGTSVLFKFTADGRYEESIYIEATTYNCHTKLFIYNAGTVKFGGAEFRVYPTTGRVRSSDTCNAQFNYDRADDIARKQGDRFSWAFEKNASDGRTYLMIGVDGDMRNRASFRPAS